MLKRKLNTSTMSKRDLLAHLLDKIHLSVRPMTFVLVPLLPNSRIVTEEFDRFHGPLRSPRPTDRQISAAGIQNVSATANKEGRGLNVGGDIRQ